jgi:secreted PhoX family phosphatase
MGAENLSRSQLFELSENEGRNASANPTMGDIIVARFSRRDLMKGVLGVAAINTTIGGLALSSAPKAMAAASSFGFAELEAEVDDKHHVAPGYKAEVLIRWGDPVLPGAPEFDIDKQTADAQSKQFGYNNDYLGFFPIDGSNEHGLLAVNHEYTTENLMFPGIDAEQDGKGVMFKKMTPELAAIEMAAHGGAVIEVKKENGAWTVVKDSRYARRITMATPMEITGPAAGHARMKTSADPAGTKVFGMLNNCAGGMTPWGTWVSGEENVHGYFWGDLWPGHANAKAFKRYGVPGKWYNWGDYEPRFHIGREPNEANRFGWIVEIDPYDPASVPKKRTAMGRFKHEGANLIVGKDGRVAAYMGDDERFDYLYRFITNGKHDAANPQASRDLLDDGVLSVAKFNEDGTVDWLPLVHGQGKLTPENGFPDQAEVLINARLAGDALGATKMDRPEDVEPNPKTGKIYVMLTNNNRRKADQADAANPRADNKFGHIVEITPPDGDHAAGKMTWEILVKCGDPSVAEVGATFSSATTKQGWFGMPDNCAFDAEGRLWVATDGMGPKSTGKTDGVFAVETEGELRGTSKRFFSVPIGAEMCGPCFTPDGKTLFVAVQHPGEEDAEGNPGTFADPPTRWPDFKDGMPPRPSIVVITKEDGGTIGS